MDNKKTLSAKAWLWLFLLTAAAIALLIAVFNVLVDPYGAFGDPVLNWWSYDETRNPKLAKMAYLEKHHDEYDSYIIGSSEASSYPIDQLNRYLDASFYNCFFYGTDLKDYEEECLYILEHYEARYILLDLGADIAYSYDAENAGLTGTQYYAVSGTDPIKFYLPYLFADPVDAWKKLQYYWHDDDYVLQQPYRVFDEKGSLEEYLDRPSYEGFRSYTSSSRSLPYLSEAMESVRTIKTACQEHGAELIVICNPVYYEAEAYYSEEDMASFRNALASVTDYWDFTLTPASYDPRFFYDLTHFRNCLGRMLLARVFRDDSIYYPEIFGQYVPMGTAPGAPQAEAMPQEEYSRQIPILMYHHLTEEGEVNDSTVTVAAFTEQMRALYESGWESVSFAQLQRYVETGQELPGKCFVLTFDDFDDGYESNTLLAYPVLKEYGFCAAIFPIGVSMGKDTYKDTGVPMIPHFSVEQGMEMVSSGLITLGSHGYDVHEVTGRDEEPIRAGALPREEESETQYALFMKYDCARMRGLLGMDLSVFAYPYGKCTELTEVVLRNEGFAATLTTESKTNTVIKGIPQSLLQMGRFRITDDMTGADVLEWIAS